MPQVLLARRSFAVADQDWFALLSGDRNPIHVDAVAARRTQAGAPVVHGIHMLLRGIDLLAARYPDLPPIGTLFARFNKPVYVGDTVDFMLSEKTESGCVIRVLAGGRLVSRFVLGFGPAGQPGPVCQREPLWVADRPLDLSMEQTEQMSGRVAFPTDTRAVAETFPSAVRAWTLPRILSVLSTTTLVGMICPGLHSMFGELTLNASAIAEEANALNFRVTSVDRRVRMVQMEVLGDGVFGGIGSFLRQPPARQAAIADLAGLVERDAFAGSTALVVGGSRGLGEIAAKLLAAGGANVIVTYAVGLTDATALADSIQSWGGDCRIMPYDVLRPAGPQLASLQVVPTHLYYFATPPIFRRGSGVFDADRWAEFQAFYLHGFHDLFQALRAASVEGLAVFYPSSIAVETRPAGMTEYAMAKMAGEILCADLVAGSPKSRIVTRRLPRVPTDQTATLIETGAADPVAELLPIIRLVQG